MRRICSACEADRHSFAQRRLPSRIARGAQPPSAVAPAESGRRPDLRSVGALQHRRPRQTAVLSWHGSCVKLGDGSQRCGSNSEFGQGRPINVLARSRVEDAGRDALGFFSSRRMCMNRKEDLMSEPRRDFIKGTVATAAALAATAATPRVWAAGSDAPEKKEVRIGFIPLTDCASIVMASTLKLDEKHGIKIIPTKEASWAGVRDKLVNGELDMAHVLYGLVYGVHLGVSGPKKDMAVLMTLNNNGQAITLSKKLADKGAVDGASLAKAMSSDKRDYTFA